MRSLLDPCWIPAGSLHVPNSEQEPVHVQPMHTTQHASSTQQSVAAPHSRCHGNSGTTAGWLPLLSEGVASQPPFAPLLSIMKAFSDSPHSTRIQAGTTTTERQR
ncbi:uncharacterized protein V6R79_011143 [Siganus canaliculatus]